jgi:hypothetical protein
MAGRRYLKEDFLLPFEQNLTIIHAAGQDHQPVDSDQLLRGQATG